MCPAYAGHTQQFAKMAGFGLNLKLVLYLQSQCLTESLGFLNPPLLQAAKRCIQYIFRTGEFNNLMQQMINFIFVELWKNYAGD